MNQPKACLIGIRQRADARGGLHTPWGAANAVGGELAGPLPHSPHARTVFGAGALDLRRASGPLRLVAVDIVL